MFTVMEMKKGLHKLFIGSMIRNDQTAASGERGPRAVENISIKQTFLQRRKGKLQYGNTTESMRQFYVGNTEENGSRAKIDS